jgi:hypothetical protein
MSDTHLQDCNYARLCGCIAGSIIGKSAKTSKKYAATALTTKSSHSQEIVYHNLIIPEKFLTNLNGITIGTRIEITGSMQNRIWHKPDFTTYGYEILVDSLSIKKNHSTSKTVPINKHKKFKNK